MYLSRKTHRPGPWTPSDDRRLFVDPDPWRDEERFMGDSPVPRRPASASKAGIPLLGTELPVDLDLSRRDILKIGGYTSLAAFLAACSTGGGGAARPVRARSRWAATSPTPVPPEAPARAWR